MKLLSKLLFWRKPKPTTFPYYEYVDAIDMATTAMSRVPLFPEPGKIVAFMPKGELQKMDELNRVKINIGDAVAIFVKRRLNEEFTAKELYAFVSERVDNLAPDSPNRVMRDLRKRGVINYEVISRRESRYRSIPAAIRADVDTPIINVAVSKESL